MATPESSAPSPATDGTTPVTAGSDTAAGQVATMAATGADTPGSDTPVADAAMADASDPAPSVPAQRVEAEISWKSAWRLVAVVVATLALFLMVASAKTLVSMLAISFFFSLALEPAVQALHRKRSGGDVAPPSA